MPNFTHPYFGRRSADQARLFNGFWSSVLAKFMIFVMVVYVIINSFTDPSSMVFSVKSAETIFGTCMVMALAVSAALILADILVNDMAPDEFQFTLGLKMRRWIYLFTAAILTMIGYASSVNGSVFKVGSTWLYFGFSVSGYALGYLDAIAVGRIRQSPGRPLY